MILQKKYKLIYLVMAFAVTLFFGCESNFKEVQKINFTEFTPSGDADKVNLKYTDSGLIKVVLISPKMLDFATVAFPFTEFPKGIDVTLYDDKGKTTRVTSNYAISYKQTSIIDLQGKVKILSEDGQQLETEQLYFDQKNEWFYTEKKFKFTDQKGTSNGQGIDFSKDFKIINSQRIMGEIESSE
ncbi:MAG: LPS export ABC transporter periplasmic protein LptC [Flavobacteriaceae bacterium]|jgi:LPS export ABC transporter protein LptC|uniref:LPS export ABC transporter periplasmic protein LptC n=1 Tax=Flavobacterium kayseriense TaxID=2764714 RepID=A0ABR7J654_9FLAO|nr:LPS export ABC transporter periplasmic protein LptC [Flavobacterium kayseriense]MBC5840921.1 LPS export ABC transporter periplasmic protein LptC [Flavobacterium kayseriense]MBC5846410.1 LPS export ABC transporter periplasmic protein LptC [Flavobacterium kayseriense]MBU0940898.1 LPS export ABC transporter periplasmic protein LptC [Bacteroidota bacterium]MBX9886386.1 LPS export ABC transporter periplasmic protein LptC [Flavobacteriaceae bacterium]